MNIRSVLRTATLNGIARASTSPRELARETVA